MGAITPPVHRTLQGDSMKRRTFLAIPVLSVAAMLALVSIATVSVATGALPLIPPIAGLDKVNYLTSDNLWSLAELPRRLIVLGGGPIGTELAQAFVVWVARSPRLK